MSFPYKRILVIGATSGIGKALAVRFIKEGARVIVSGRRVENLDAFVEEHGSDKAAAIPFDITQLDKIPAYVDEVTGKFPDLDCVFINSGIQRHMKLLQPSSVDLGVFGEELTTNYVAVVHLTLAFMPFLLARASSPSPSSPSSSDGTGAGGDNNTPVAFAYTTSGLALVPSPRVPGYSGSKAALHAFIMSLRAQLRKSGRHPGMRVIELLPPLVQTELHDARHQPELGGRSGGSGPGVPLDRFTQLAWEGLSGGVETIVVAAERGLPSAQRLVELEQQDLDMLTEKVLKPEDV